MITSIYENDTPDIQYGACELYDDADFRGITSGMAGFCTSSECGDALLVIQAYGAAVGAANNELNAFLPMLQSNVNNGANAMPNFNSYCSAWAAASSKSAFITAQTSVADELYMNPAEALSDSYKLTLPLSRAFVYDTCIQVDEP